MSKFKVGDTVIITGQPSHVGDSIKIGSEGIVSEYCPIVDNYRVSQGLHNIEPTFQTMADGTQVPVREGNYNWYHATSLQLKSEYDMENNQRKTEVTRIPFDLECAKKGDKVINGAGDPVRILTFDRVIHGGLYPIVALHMDSGYEILLCHRLNGESISHDFIYKEHLFMAPVEKTGWITIVRPCLGSATMCTNIRDTRDDAILEAKERYMKSDIICTKQITWEE